MSIASQVFRQICAAIVLIIACSAAADEATRAQVPGPTANDVGQTSQSQEKIDALQTKLDALPEGSPERAQLASELLELKEQMRAKSPAKPAAAAPKPPSGLPKEALDRWQQEHIRPIEERIRDRQQRLKNPRAYGETPESVRATLTQLQGELRAKQQEYREWVERMKRTYPNGAMLCSRCQGTGRVETESVYVPPAQMSSGRTFGGFNMPTYAKCRDCGGDGWIGKPSVDNAGLANGDGKAAGEIPSTQPGSSLSRESTDKLLTVRDNGLTEIGVYGFDTRNRELLRGNDNKPFTIRRRGAVFVVDELWGVRDVIAVHPKSAKESAQVDFSELTSRASGTLVLQFHNFPGGDCEAVIMVDGKRFGSVQVRGDTWRNLSVPFTQARVVVEARATGWFREHCFLSYRILPRTKADRPIGDAEIRTLDLNRPGPETKWPNWNGPWRTCPVCNGTGFDEAARRANSQRGAAIGSGMAGTSGFTVVRNALSYCDGCGGMGKIPDTGGTRER